MRRLLVLTAALLVGIQSIAAAEELRNGRRFDTGATMTERAAGAPEELDKAAFYRGQWDVEYRTFSDDGSEHTAACLAEVTYVNRGHGFMESLHCDDHDGAGNELDTISFLIYNPGGSRWLLGEANGFTESIRISHGGFEEDRLELSTAIRLRGGGVLTHLRQRFERAGEDAFRLVVERSTDDGASWAPIVAKSYKRRESDAEFMAPASDFGSPAPDLPPEARQFDFLIGRWLSNHDLKLPNGQNPRWQANSTAIHALNGRAVMEFNWFDVDPSLPDAATTIVRLYNRSMRRWESLFVPNRFHSLLHFGGRMEGDRIVLHPFEATTADANISQWVFHDLAADSYGWFANQSTDRGATWAKTWIIQASRVKEEATE